MYNLIIVDDESGTHELLKEYIEEIIGGYRVVGCFLNGEEAVRYIKDNEVDVVLTDIKMPVMNGLELCEYISKNKPDINVVILSGYGEFEYAKKAIEYNVTDYLLKAVDIQELTRVLRKISDRLDLKYAKGDNEAWNIESFCTDIIAGSLTRDEIIRRYHELSIPYNIENVRISIYRLEFENYHDVLNKWRYESEYFQDAIMGVIQSVVNENGGGIAAEVYSNRECILAGVFSEANLNGFENVISRDIYDIMGLKIKCRVLLDYIGIFDVSNNNHILNNNEIYKIMISYIKMNGTDKAKKIIRRMMKLNDAEIENIDDKYKIAKSDDVDGVYEDIRSKLDDSEIISIAKAYIKQNFDKDISRQDIADVVFFNAAYFSRYFKQQTGIALGDYILKIRMNNVIQLLNTSEKIQDISNKSGFKNVRHFQRTFKLYTGFSPSDYRKIVLKKEH